MRDYPIQNAYFHARVASESPNDEVEATQVEAGYSRDNDAHVVTLYPEGTPTTLVLSPSEALKLAAALTLAAEAAITKDNS